MVLGMKCTFSTLILKNCIFFIFQTHLTIQNIALLKYAVSVLIYYSTKFISVPKLAGKMPVCLQWKIEFSDLWYKKPNEKAYNRNVSKRRIYVEHINRYIKRFKILSSCYRNKIRYFGLRIALICGIYNFQN